MSIIRHRYILEGGARADAKLRLIRDLKPRELEYLTAALFRGQGYDVEITAEQKDGGKDIIAVRGSEKVFIECKNWGGKVKVAEVRAFTAVCGGDSVTRGVFVAPSGQVGSRLGVRRRQPVGHCSRETGTVSCFLMGRGWFGSSMSTSALIGISGRMESSHGIAEPSLADIRAAPCAVRTSLLTTRAGRFSHDCGYVRCPSRNLRICHRSASARSSCAAAPDFGKGYSDRVLGSRGWGAFTAA